MVDVCSQVKKESPSLFIILFTDRCPQPEIPHWLGLPECAHVVFADTEMFKEYLYETQNQLKCKYDTLKIYCMS